MNTEIPHRFPNGTGARPLMTYDNWGCSNTVSTGHTSWPSRWSGNVAAELPTWP